MKLFLFFPILLLSNEVFVLPQETDYFIDSYTKSLEGTQKEVYIFSDIIDDYTVIKTLKKLSKRNIQIHIISQDLYKQDNRVTYLNLLKGVHLYTLTQTKDKVLKGSYTCIDDKSSYLSTQNLAHSGLIRNHSFVSFQRHKCKDTFTHLLELCTKIK